jgi:hypothetical protein
MSQLRIAALLTLVAATGCYREAAEDSTLPEPQYVSGPPGGSMDPSPGYAYAGGPVAGRVTGPARRGADPNYDPNPAGADDPGAGAYDPSTANADSDSGDDTADPSPGLAQSPDAGPDGIAGTPDDNPDAGANLTASVTDSEIDSTLDGYGQWVETDDYGQIWRPDATVVGVDFTPYESGGSWEYTDAGWAFACDYPWGWLPFHYGRWAWFHGYWGWVPGYHWGPAWVEWRHGSGVLGWRPLAPHGGSGHRWHGGDVAIRDHRHAEQHDAHWRFAATTDFAKPHIRSHLYGNPAEGLRITSSVAAPPIRGRNAIRATDLMRNRVAASGARGFAPNIRDHRAGQSPSTTFAPPTRYRSPVRSQPNQLPVRSYPSAQPYQPPVRTYPAQPGQTYQPTRPYPGQPYQPPVRSYQPTPGTQRPPYQPYPGTQRPPYQPYPGTQRPPYQPYPGTRPPVYQPNPSSRPPVYQPNPSSRPPVYQPNPGSRPPLFRPSQPSRPFQPSSPSPSPSGGPRSWGSPSPSSSGGSHSWSAPSHASSPSSSSSSSSHSSSSTGGSHHR